MKHIVIWGAWYGSRNVGDQALLLTIMDILAKTVGEVRFTVFTDNPVHVNAYTRQESRCQVRALHNRRQFPRVVYALATCDLFVFGGGVPFFEERSHVLVMALLVGLVRFFRTPYMTWTVSSQVVRDPTAKKVFGWVLQGASAITVRDEHTRELFRSCGVQKPITITGDSGFWLDAGGAGPIVAETEGMPAMIRRAGYDGGRPLVALTPRTLRSRDGEAETHYNPKTPAQFEREVDCFVAVLDWLWENCYQPIFVPMNTTPPDDDRIAARLVMQHARYGGRALLIDEEIRPRLAPRIYKQCRVSFVARVHGSITSMVAQTPIMMYAFAPKHAGIMTSMGLQAYTLAEAEATPDRAVQMISELLRDHDAVQQQMASQLDALRQQALIPAQMAADIVHPDKKMSE